MARTSYPPALGLSRASAAHAPPHPPHHVSPALEAAVQECRDTPSDPPGSGAISRPYAIPGWLGGTAAEARLVDAHSQADELGATLRGVSVAARRLKEDTQRITARALAERFAPIDALPAGVVYLTADRILTANTHFASLIGRPRHRVEHAVWWHLVAPEDAEALAAAAFGPEAARILAAVMLPDYHPFVDRDGAFHARVDASTGYAGAFGLAGGPGVSYAPAHIAAAVGVDVMLPDTPGRAPSTVVVRALADTASGLPERRALAWEVGPVHRGAVYCVVRPLASRAPDSGTDAADPDGRDHDPRGPA